MSFFNTKKYNTKKYTKNMNIFFYAISLLIAITVHEYAHARSALALGDTTAKRAGRVSLNPLKHLDPLGVLSFILIKVGWGKPVPVNEHNFKNRKRDAALVAFAGPASNIVLAAIATAVLVNIAIPTSVAGFVNIFIFTNLVLAIFNLLPIPPLDGSNILFSLLPNSLYKYEVRIRRNGPFLLIGLLLVDHLLLKHYKISLVGTVIGGGVNLLSNLLVLAS